MSDGLAHGRELTDRQRLWVRLGLTAILLGMWTYLVPFELWKLRNIHQEHASEIASIDGFEAIEVRADWIPSFSGATVILQPLDGRDVAQLSSELQELGWAESDGPKPFVRDRTDNHGAEWLDVIERSDSSLRVMSRVERLGRVPYTPLYTVLAILFAIVFLRRRVVHAHEFHARPPGFH